jgi:HEAT repeat protein
MKHSRLAILTILASILALPAMAEGVDLGKVFDELARYDSGKSPVVLEQIRIQMRNSSTNSALRAELEKRMIAVLESTEATIDGKQFACKQLGRIGTGASVPALAKLLKDKKSAGSAVFALQDIAIPAAGAALRQAVDNSPAELDVIQALSVRNEKESIPVLVRLTEAADAAVSAAAMTALGFFADEGAAEVLSGLVKKPGDAGPVHHARLRCAQSLAAAGKREPALTVYRQLYELKAFPLIRRGALLGIIEHGDAEGGALLLAVLKGKDPDLRWAAIGSGLRRLGDRADSVAGESMKILPGLPTAEQAALLAALVDQRGPAMLPHMLKLVKSDSSEQREAGLRGLARIGDATAVPALIKAAGNEGAEKKLALAALRQLQGDRVDPAIGDALGKANVQLKTELLAVLRGRNAVSQVPVILASAEHADTGVAIAAWKALGELAGKDHLRPLLTALLRVENEKTISVARKTLLLTARRTEAEGELACRTSAALTHATSDSTRQALLRLLGGLPCERSFSALTKAMNDSNEAIKDVALRELFDWPGAEALPVLERVAADSDNKVHRVLALRGYARLLGTAGTGSADDRATRYLKAVSIAKQALADKTTCREAALTIIRMAPVAAGLDPVATRAALAAAAKQGKDPDLAAAAQSFIRCIDGFADFVVKWQVSPAYGGKPCTQLFEQVFDPEKKGGKVAWSLMPVGTNPQQPWLINIGGFHSEDPNQVTYLRTSIKSAVARKARFEMGSDDGIKVWVNGELVHANNALRGVTPGQDKAEATLKAGMNDILVKVTQNVGPWGLCMRLQSLEPVVTTEPKAETVAIFKAPSTTFDNISRVITELLCSQHRERRYRGGQLSNLLGLRWCVPSHSDESRSLRVICGTGMSARRLPSTCRSQI